MPEAAASSASAAIVSCEFATPRSVAGASNFRSAE